MQRRGRRKRTRLDCQWAEWEVALDFSIYACARTRKMTSQFAGKERSAPGERQVRGGAKQSSSSGGPATSNQQPENQQTVLKMCPITVPFPRSHHPASWPRESFCNPVIVLLNATFVRMVITPEAKKTGKLEKKVRPLLCLPVDCYPSHDTR